MTTGRDDDPPAPPPGPYFSTWGPVDGPILHRHRPPTMGVVTDRAFPMPIGMALSGGWTSGEKGAVATFRLVVGGVKLEGRWICVAREFVRLGDAAD